MLQDGFHDIPPGKVAAIVTHLEMRAPAPSRPVPWPDGVAMVPVPQPDLAWYRALFRRVGAADWLWFSRLTLTDPELRAILLDPAVEVFCLRLGDEDLGLLELDFRQPEACELAYFGVARELIGTGAGRALMNEAISRAWSRPIRRFHVHTCTLDSPQALPFYIRSGFEPIRQQVEIAPDPRLTGVIVESAAPQVPILR